jgi:hypothetical protein
MADKVQWALLMAYPHPSPLVHTIGLSFEKKVLNILVAEYVSVVWNNKCIIMGLRILINL